ncbi:MAG: hypothetical protein ABI384_02635 [Allobranchiibius sp.]
MISRVVRRFVGATASAGSAVVLVSCASGGYSGPPSWTAQSPSGVFVAGAPAPGSVQRSTVQSPTWTLTTSTPGDPNVDPNTWPDADTALSSRQLKSLFPDAADIGAASCIKLTLPSGAKTAKNTRCDWSVTFGKNTSQVAALTVILRGFGADSAMTRAWSTRQAQQVTGRFSGDTFYAPGTYGAKGVYFLSNGQASLLISNGSVAGWLDVEFANFDGALGKSTDDAAKIVRAQIFPIVVEDLVGHLPRTGVGTPLTATGS